MCLCDSECSSLGCWHYARNCRKNLGSVVHSPSQIKLKHTHETAIAVAFGAIAPSRNCRTENTFFVMLIAIVHLHLWKLFWMYTVRIRIASRSSTVLRCSEMYVSDTLFDVTVTDAHRARIYCLCTLFNWTKFWILCARLLFATKERERQTDVTPGDTACVYLCVCHPHWNPKNRNKRWKFVSTAEKQRE